MTDRQPRVFGTGYQRTTVESVAPGLVRWTRTPGVDNPNGFRRPPEDFAERVTDLADCPAQFLVPRRAEPQQVSWECAGATCFAAVVQADPGSAAAITGMTDLGRSLRAFHAGPEAATPPDAPPSLQRFSQWLHDGAGTRASRPWRVHLRGRLGPQRWNLLVEAAHALLDNGCSMRTMTHGWMSLGNVVVADAGTSAAGGLQILSGTDVGTGPPEVDVGCLLGELAEFTLRAEHFGQDAPAFRELSAAFLTGYGGSLDADLLAGAQAVRVAQHSSDFANFLGWHEDLELYPDMVCSLLDSVPAAC